MNQRSVRPRVWPWVIKAVVLAAAYFVVARVGLRYAAIGESISPVWPPTGLALAALLVLGPRYWPAVFFGALLANAATAVPLTAATGIAAGNTAEAVLGAYLLRRLAGGPGVAFDHLVAVLARLLVAELVLGRLFPVSFLPQIEYPYLLFPLVIGAALRIGPRGASLATLVVALIAVGHAARGGGPFAMQTVPSTAVALVLYIGLLAVTGLTLGAVAAQGRRAATALRDAPA